MKARKFNDSVSYCRTPCRSLSRRLNLACCRFCSLAGRNGSRVYHRVPAEKSFYITFDRDTQKRNNNSKLKIRNLTNYLN
ncbi:hypothetical protein PUN28_014386 [Cardiocondyla obscurior]|uniref:Uncharacterized protein n=1 Tax=Cardiocondyla obscurior TaxID=286306 RepID=A0AAW2F1H6_9HYME